MIISSRRKSRSSFERLFSVFRRKKREQPVIVLSDEQFRLEVLKERSRIERRKTGEFAILRLSGVTELSDEALDNLAVTYADRLRVTDCIGWQREVLVVLLPETDRDGACVVANALVKIALDFDCQLESEILVFPHDDDISSGADEFDEFVGGADDDSGEIDRLNGISIDRKDSPISSTSRQSDVSGNIVASLGQTRSSLDTSLDFSLPTPWWKRTTDLVGAATGLILMSPVFILTAIAIKLTSRGPVFFRQAREGKGGKTFYIYKFRTMRNDAESLQFKLREKSEQDGPAFKLTNDPRVTSIGRYLRKSCIDELPQLVNIIRGEMSLVGPRPLPIAESTACKIWQRRRLQVVPGLTCIWQVDGGRETRFEDWMRMDMEYLERKGFWFDLGIIVKTAFVAVLHRGSV